MAVVISFLRGVNVGGHHLIKMDALRELYISLRLRDAATYLQSGNVVFRTAERDLDKLARRIESALEKACGFHADVICRTTAELRSVVERSPFAGRPGIEPPRLVVMFLAAAPGEDARARLGAIQPNPEEMHLGGRELYAYFPEGFGNSKLPAAIDKALKAPLTARNWNTVTKVLEMAEALEASA